MFLKFMRLHYRACPAGADTVTAPNLGTFSTIPFRASPKYGDVENGVRVERLNVSTSLKEI